MPQLTAEQCQVAEDNYRLIFFIAKSIAREFRETNIDDIVDAVTEEYMPYTQSYDTSLGITFASYAQKYIQAKAKRRLLKDLGYSRKSTAGKEQFTRKVIFTMLPDERGSVHHYDFESGEWGDVNYPNPALRAESFEDDVLDRIDNERIREALKKIDPLQAKVLYYHAIQGKTQQQIADIVGCSQYHVSRLITRGKAALKLHLEYPLTVISCDYQLFFKKRIPA